MEKEPAHILVVDDDTRLRSLLNRYLIDHGFRVTSAADVADARRQLAAMTFDLMVLDIMMPDESGIDFVRSLRPANMVPILMLTALGETDDRIRGLEGGADDYLTKPFEPRELVLRLNAILRRTSTPIPPSEIAPSTVRLGVCVFDRNRQILLRDGVISHLPAVEANLLATLAATPGSVVSRAELIERCAIAGGERSIDVHVTRLRRQIEPDPRTPCYLKTVRGFGYRLQPD